MNVLCTQIPNLEVCKGEFLVHKVVYISLVQQEVLKQANQYSRIIKEPIYIEEPINLRMVNYI
jgi:hypothetical protein